MPLASATTSAPSLRSDSLISLTSIFFGRKLGIRNDSFTPFHERPAQAKVSLGNIHQDDFQNQYLVTAPPSKRIVPALQTTTEFSMFTFSFELCTATLVGSSRLPSYRLICQGNLEHYFSNLNYFQVFHARPMDSLQYSWHALIVADFFTTSTSSTRKATLQAHWVACWYPKFPRRIQGQDLR